MRFSPVTIERFQDARFEGFISRPEVMGMSGNYQSGRFIILGLRFVDGVIVDARFRCFNCISAIAAADWLCEQLEGCSPEVASSISVQDIDDALGGLPLGRRFCAQMTRDALTAALERAHRDGYYQ